jgi:hypothetical protein
MATFGPQTISETGDLGFQQGTWSTGIVLIGIDGASYNAGWRWQNVTVPALATITSATLHVRARNAISGGVITDVHGKFRGYKGDAPQWQTAVFVPDPTVTPGGSGTTAGTDWDPTVWVVNDYYDIDLTAVVQEIVNGTWTSGFDLAIAGLDDGTAAGVVARFYQFDDGDTNANTITIVYEVGTLITPGAGSVPFTGRTVSLGFTIGMPDQP